MRMSTGNFGDFQAGIYARGLQGERVGLPLTFAELEERAFNAMPPDIWSYVAGGAGNEHTQRSNITGFDRWGIVPRMLVPGERRDLSIELFGLQLPSPLLLAPIGVIGICTRDGHGDLATARAAADTKVPMIASTLATDPLEDVAAALGETPGFFQLYTPRDRDLAESFIKRAEAAGFKALVVTLDTWTLGWRPRDLRTGNFPQLRGNCLANYFSDPHFLERLEQSPAEDLRAAARAWSEVFGQPMTWDDIDWIRGLTDLPLLLKGICHPDDVRRAIDAGVDGIYCSNHGGRQANGGVPAIEHLPAVVDAAGDVPVIFDSGVRAGEHIVKALALGARAVAIGRPYAYGAALAGDEGIAHVLRCLLAEADLLMGIDGYPTIGHLSRDALTRVA